jgi:hypothetical protein
MSKKKPSPLQKYTFPRTLLDLFVVFLGVFIAFLLNNWNETRKEKRELTQKYLAIYEDLERFHSAGTNPENNFIDFFKDARAQWDSIVSSGQVPPPNFRIYGDWYHLEIVETMVVSGQLNDVDVVTFKQVSRYRTIHRNFLAQIEAFNNYYERQVTPRASQSKETFYHPDGRLREEYTVVGDYLTSIIDFANVSVSLAEQLKEQIKKRHLSGKIDE